jgi:phosphatidylserine/phosphatidylglycerophosphate/cardiolipin synthase-like enzyme
LLGDALRRRPELRVMAVVPRYPERSGRVAEASEIIGRQLVLKTLYRAGGPRVAVYDLENAAGIPIYVHAKVCVVDDVWLEVGSDNLNRRSWTHDSEISCAMIDAEVDDRQPQSPGGEDRARRLTRDTRLGLWREHLGRRPDDDADLVDAASGFQAFREVAETLEAWHQGGRVGRRPVGHIRPHRPDPVPTRSRWWAHALHRMFVDPDGRSLTLRRRHHM